MEKRNPIRKDFSSLQVWVYASAKYTRAASPGWGVSQLKQYFFLECLYIYDERDSTNLLWSKEKSKSFQE